MEVNISGLDPSRCAINICRGNQPTALGATAVASEAVKTPEAGVNVRIDDQAPEIIRACGGFAKDLFEGLRGIPAEVIKTSVLRPEEPKLPASPPPTAPSGAVKTAVPPPAPAPIKSVGPTDAEKTETITKIAAALNWTLPDGEVERILRWDNYSENGVYTHIRRKIAAEAIEAACQKLGIGAAHSWRLGVLVVNNQATPDQIAIDLKAGMVPDDIVSKYKTSRADVVKTDGTGTDAGSADDAVNGLLAGMRGSK